MKVSAYLHFDGRCEEAFAFYASLLGGEVTNLMRWSEMPGDTPSGMERKVMHAHLKVGSSDILGSDQPTANYVPPAGFGVTLELESSEEAERIYAGLSKGGSVRMPIGETFFAHRFAMLTDRYSIPWLIVQG